MLNDDHPLIDAAKTLAPALSAGAAQVERDGVDRSGLDRLAEAGLYGVQGPEWAGGSEAPPSVYRRVAEVLAGADGNIWLVWFQHHPVVRMLAASSNTALQAQLPDLCLGRRQAGVAFSHLRNRRPTVSAQREGDGWRLSGRQPWCTGWGLIDVVLVGAVTEDDDVLFAVVPAVDGDGLKSAGELSLAAMGGTRTVALEFDGLLVTPDHVVMRMPRPDWSIGDAMRATNIQPSAVGVALAALDALHVSAPAVGAKLGSELSGLRARAYELADEPPTADDVAERLCLAAGLLRLGVEITSSLVASLGGLAMSTSHPAQRWAREATFHLVFAQTSGLREAVLAAAETG